MESFEIKSIIKVYNLTECDQQTRLLIEQAKDATKAAYAPYSGYHVGCAALLKDGTIVTGNNQENAAYPSGLCAERTALFYANSQYPDIPIISVAIAAFHQGEFTEDICTPCGACRQVFSEIEKRYNYPIRIIMCGKDKVYEVQSVQHLLPLSFGKENMG